MFNTKERARTRGGGHRQHPAGGLPMPSKNQRSKSPHIQGNQAATKWGPRTSATLPNPVLHQQQPAKVRVQAGAGDKCVPPAKSKQKRRQGVPGRPVDMSALSMDAVIWSDEVYTVDQLVHAYGGKLPVIAKVMEGFQNNTGFSLQPNQVIQCHSYAKEKRIRAELGSGTISIPANYPIHIHTKHGDQEDRLPLSQALERNTLPMKVLVTSMDEDIEVTTVNVLGRHLVITECYEQLFLRTTTISDGWVDQEAIHAIPACFDAAFSVAVGMRGANEDEWIDYYGMFARSVRHLKFMLLMGYEGIIIENSGSGTIKLEISRPSSKRDSRASGPLYENLTRSQSERHRPATLEAKPSTSNHTQGVGYENWELRPTGQQVLLRSKSEKPKNRPITMDFEEDRAPRITINPMASSKSRSPDTGFDSPTSRLPDVVSTNSRSPVSPNRPQKVTSEGEYDVHEMFQSVIDVAEEQETLKRQTEEDKKRDNQEMLFVQRRQEEQRRREQIRAQIQQKELARMNSDQPNNSSPFKLITPSSENDNRIPSYRSSSSSHDSAMMQVSDVHVEVHQMPNPVQQTPNSRNSTCITSRDRGVKTLTKQFQLDEPTTNINNNYPPQKLNITHHNDPPAPSRSPAAHVVKISVTNTPKHAHNGHVTSDVGNKNVGNVSKPSNINCVDDIPTDIIGLSVEDVGKCLALLDMDRHITEFKGQRVDGKALISLKEINLIDKFKLTPFNASKLLRFVRGWRPKSVG